MRHKTKARRDVVTLVRRQHDHIHPLFDAAGAAQRARRRDVFRPLGNLFQRPAAAMVNRVRALLPT